MLRKFRKTEKRKKPSDSLSTLRSQLPTLVFLINRRYSLLMNTSALLSPNSPTDPLSLTFDSWRQPNLGFPPLIWFRSDCAHNPTQFWSLILYDSDIVIVLVILWLCDRVDLFLLRLRLLAFNFESPLTNFTTSSWCQARYTATNDFKLSSSSSLALTSLTEIISAYLEK